MTVEVDGRWEGSLAAFILIAEGLIEAEQNNPTPDDALIVFLYDSVRLAREHEILVNAIRKLIFETVMESRG